MSAVFPTGIPFLKNSDADRKIQIRGVEKSLIMSWTLLGVKILQTARIAKNAKKHQTWM